MRHRPWAAIGVVAAALLAAPAMAGTLAGNVVGTKPTWRGRAWAATLVATLGTAGPGAQHTAPYLAPTTRAQEPLMNGASFDWSANGGQVGPQSGERRRLRLERQRWSGRLAIRQRCSVSRTCATAHWRLAPAGEALVSKNE